MVTEQKTVYAILKGQKIVNVYEGRPNGSILIRLQNGTEIVMTKGLIRETDSEPVLIG